MSEIKQDIAIQLMHLKAEVLFQYGIDLGARSVQLVGEIDEHKFKLIDAALNMLESDSKKAVTIRINSGGGSIYDAMAIISRMRSSSCKIITEGHGCIMSAAGVIFAAGKKRRMAADAMFMWHEGSWNPQESTVTQLKHQIAQSEREMALMCKQMAKYSTMPAAYWAENGLSGNDLFLTPEEALLHGIVDEIF